MKHNRVTPNPAYKSNLSRIFMSVCVCVWQIFVFAGVPHLVAYACVFSRLVDVCTSVCVCVYMCCAFAGQCFAGCVCYKPPFCGCPSFADVSHLVAFACFFFHFVFFRIVFSRLCSHSRWPPGVCSGGGLWRPRTDPVETYLLWEPVFVCCMLVYLPVCMLALEYGP